jgi:predicted DNA-binding transcriptional regulator AlpA
MKTDKLLTTKEVYELLQINRRSFLRLRERGLFPEPVKHLCSDRKYWPISTVKAWVADLKKNGIVYTEPRKKKTVAKKRRKS